MWVAGSHSATGARHAVLTHGGRKMSAVPLSGVRVLDLTRLLPGAFCTMLLADMGADVVRAEKPSGRLAGSWARSSVWSGEARAGGSTRRCLTALSAGLP